MKQLPINILPQRPCKFVLDLEIGTLCCYSMLKCIFSFSLRDTATGLINMFSLEGWIMLDLKEF
jgi:hypothetical protein